MKAITALKAITGIKTIQALTAIIHRINVRKIPNCDIISIKILKFANRIPHVKFVCV
jgi:hypothetical protein